MSKKESPSNTANSKTSSSGVADTSSSTAADPELVPDNPHAAQYSDNAFWSKVTRLMKGATRPVLKPAFQLYFALPKSPPKAKAIIFGALGYLISPVDVIPDLLPGGYVDDVGVLLAAVAAVAAHIDDEVNANAEEALRKLGLGKD